MPTLGNALDFSKYEARNIRAHQLGTAPSSPVTGQLYYNTADNTLYWWDGTAWQSAKGGVAATPPATTTSLGTIQLAGDLAGTATSPQIAAGVITDTDVNAANKDGVVGIASMRTLGAGAQQAMPGNRTLDAITAPAADLNINSKRLLNVADPTANTDGANKQYVDNLVQGISAKASVWAASTTNVDIAAGGAGTGYVIDGVTFNSVSSGTRNRALLKNQTNPAENGIYIVTGTAGGPQTMARATDMDNMNEFPGAYTWVEGGTTQADTGWLCTTDPVAGSTIVANTWTQFSGAAQIIAGAGLTKSVNTLDVGGTANRITVGADTVDIAATYVGQSSITTLGTITTGVWNGSAIPVANGGTGQTTAKAARETGLSAAGFYSNGATHGAGTTITITQATHGLRATRALMVQVVDNATGAVEIPDIVIAANGDVTITYGAALTANTKLVTIVG